MTTTDRQEVAVGAVETFAIGTFVTTTIGETPVGIIRLHSGQWRAVRNLCPHKGAPICRGIVGGTWAPSAPGELAFERDGEVLVCPWHGFEYDLETGVELYQNTPTRLRLYPVAVRDGQVFVTV